MRYPYVGITGFETIGQVNTMLDVFERSQKELLNPIKYKLMIGLMISYKTLNDIPSKWSSIWVPKENIKHLFIEHPLACNALHYADYDGKTETKHLVSAVGYGGRDIHALQLDMIWPSDEMLSELKKEYPKIDIVLQVSTPALAQVEDDPSRLIKRLEEYEGLIDFVLLDKSMGRGKRMDALGLIPFVDGIINSMLSLDITFAGGLGPDTLHLGQLLVNKYSGLSIDAQAQLTLTGNAMDPINWTRAAKYLYKALKMLSMRKI
ncbi:MAG: hypothetical protein ACD_7C00126G0002 [uncultured bacterium]|nr:MAG: hypothetical protein ACD_7C00126G0002 [uncultured bacterium]KKP68474.1 MAG: hypothetical protein UR66_C0005G0021 [Candidatus Moranbacteria bacterium GW2011_GWE1_35_17]KKP70392.1 MAG: hypothetical protein UR65_C0044G0007 [Candidatus Moranbacteria bacterium GW2011_GWE2_35_164]KKP83776.1 MAG: hypothetical protein UR83_C0033G0006 [Candidatus Moranbacteria bacterium GW2011_GWF2_35_54]HBR79166.1 hypothetical protein [Candidatus Moranbacteria bacterium]